MSKKHLPVEVVEQVWQQRLAKMAAILLTLPDKLAAAAGTDADRRTVEVIAWVEVGAALRALSDTFDQAAEELEAPDAETRLH